jgi:hypothetical protein
MAKSRDRQATTGESPKDHILQCLEKARAILSDPDQEWFPANSFKLLDEFERLGLDTQEAQTEALARAAREVSPDDYEPPEPPGISDEQVCRGTEMIPFVWESKTFKEMMFFKFGIHRQGWLYIFSLHKADFARKKRGAR